MLEATPSGLPPLPYKLSSECPAPWPATMTFPVASSYPFLTASSDDSPNDFVVRCYLETLWLPEAICSLHHLVPSLRRVAPDSPTSPHPLPPLVTPLLLTVRDITVKYRVDLPRVIQAGEGDGQLDDAIMSFSWAHERRDDTRDGGDDDKWTKRWLQRLERRETLIQVLLHFLMLSLPLDGSRADLKRKRDKKKKSSKAMERPQSTSSLEEALDILTDRLSIWREGEEAVSTDDSQDSKLNADHRDWFQTFCEDVVQPSFSYCLPALYESLRQKAFPASPSSRPSSPSLEFSSSVPYVRPRSRSRSISIDLASAPGPRHSLLRTQSRQNGSKNNTNGRREVTCGGALPSIMTIVEMDRVRFMNLLNFYTLMALQNQRRSRKPYQRWCRMGDPPSRSAR
ncbi:hypothetical protein BS47DRAFT_108863 [Hydnum rufescens UP504]|uniref:DNA replication regulator Sld3 C-terminal domain-containing protein n=1 Tax=Hydnum rufescens UP504 TaxID=1448309 RepID=A0A9P6AQD6_9AGAM|nr:hypothetical protein BS47DRAFT_108863 [Hydnum rufescens UP504]